MQSTEPADVGAAALLGNRPSASRDFGLIARSTDVPIAVMIPSVATLPPELPTLPPPLLTGAAATDAEGLASV